MRFLVSLTARFVPPKATREMRRLMFSTAVLYFAASAVGLFEPIFLFSLGLDLGRVLLFYFGVHLLMFLLLPVGVRMSSSLGSHHAILLSSPLLIIYYLSLFAAKSNGSFLVVALISIVLHNVLYWPNFHFEMTREGQDGERGREISGLISLAMIASIAGPVVGGLLIAAFGFSALFIVASILIMASNIPLLMLPEKRASVAAPSYASLIRDFTDLSGPRKGVALSMFGFGEEMVVLVVWPIFIFTVLKGYAVTGAVVSAAILLSALAVMYVGRLSDTQSRHALVRTGTMFTAAAWIVRIFVGTKAAVLGADVFYRVSRNIVGVPLMSMIYDWTKKDPSYRPIVFFELWLAFGKAVTCLVGILLLTVFPGRFEPLFILAAFVGLLYSRFPRI